MNWKIGAFLDRAKLTRDGKLTRAAILLIGKAESAHLLSPHPALMTWKLMTEERTYKHFHPPFLLSTTELFQIIRNPQMKILPDQTLFPVEIAKYDQKVILEAIHNCIAHQNYNRNGRIVIAEYSDKLVFENEGSFFDGKPDDYVLGEKTPRKYRNPFLAQAMTELSMIDSIGYGIHNMNLWQARRYLPLPDYDLSEAGAVKLTVFGNIVDPEYSKMLIQNTDIPLEDIQALDRIQKKLPINTEVMKGLRKKKLVEGRKPRFYISAQVANATEKKADYIRYRAQDDEFYHKQIIDYLNKFHKASREEITRLLWNKLSDALNDKQKTTKISTILTKMRCNGLIENQGTRKRSKWISTKKKNA